MNVHELWQLRERGLGGRAVKKQQSNWWSKHNCPVIRRQAKPTDPKSADIFSAPALISSEESLVETTATILPHLLTERKCHLGYLNKVFASQWLDSNRVVLGTKCNKLVTYNLRPDRFHNERASRKRLADGRLAIERGTADGGSDEADQRGSVVTAPRLTRIPSLRSSQDSKWDAEESGNHSGIHAVKVNPSGTRLATGGEFPSDIAVYALPHFQPVTVGEAGHSDWMFDFEWMDDEFAVSGSRDGTLAVWRFDPYPDEAASCSHIRWVKYNPSEFPLSSRLGASSRKKTSLKYPTTLPVTTKKIPRFDRVRTLSFSKRQRSVTVASLNSCMVDVDAATLALRRATRLFSSSDFSEMVCMCHSPDESCLAVGSRSHFTVFDANNLKSILDIKLPTNRHEIFYTYPGLAPSGVRSISWRGPVATIGTGGGEMLFYDVRARRFLQCHGRGCRKDMVLRVGNGWMQSDDSLDEIFINNDCPTAVYTHCYDASGVRLFTAGGPIAASIQGNYASVWQ